MNKLSLEKKVQVIAALVEGNSIRSTCRMTGAAKGTVSRLLRDVGIACAKYQDEHLRNLTCKKIQCDEIWGFVHSKEKNVPAEKRRQVGWGDHYTWTGLCADTKLMVSWMVGKRDYLTATVFMNDLASRLSGKVQLTTDGHNV